ncbi:MAG TPA: hypothetical protein VGM39_08350 [Kofleriaceae bacterium]
MTRDAAHNRAPVAPRCFGYAPATHEFACLGHDAIYNMNNVGADDQATNLRIDLVGPVATQSWSIAAIGNRPTTARATVEAKLAAAGIQPLRSALAVPANEWVNVGRYQLQLRVDESIGDASFENFGELTLRCSPSVDILIDLRHGQMKLGETATAFLSPDGAWVAVSIVGEDGGEDTLEYSLDTAVLDLATSCTTQTAQVWTTAIDG